jgi:hypothetical protein
MKKVFSSISEAIHIYANDPMREGRASSVSFKNGVLFSYNTAIAHHVTNAQGESVMILNNTNYSNTTSKQQSRLRYATNNLKQIYVNFVEYDAQSLMPASNEICFNGLTIDKLIKNYERKAADYLAKASRARLKADDYRAAAFHELNELKTYLEFFGIEYQAGDLSALETAAIESDRKEREAAKARKIERIKEQAENLQKWRAGENVYNNFEITALRIKEDEIQTSRGARIPLDHAIKAWPLLKKLHDSGRDISLDSHSIKFGHYEMRAFKDDCLIVGCHTISFSEVQNIASQLNLGA